MVVISLLHRPCLWHFSHLILLLLLLWLKMFLLLPGYIGPAIALKIEHFLSEVSFALFITSHIFNTESKNRKLKVPYIVSVRLRPVSNVVQLPSSYCRVARLGFKRHATAVLKSNLIRSNEFGTAVARRLKRVLHSFDLKTFSVSRIILLATIRKDLIRSWGFPLFLFHFLHTVHFICLK